MKIKTALLVAALLTATCISYAQTNLILTASKTKPQLQTADGRNAITVPLHLSGPVTITIVNQFAPMSDLLIKIFPDAANMDAEDDVPAKYVKTTPNNYTLTQDSLRHKIGATLAIIVSNKANGRNIDTFVLTNAAAAPGKQPAIAAVASQNGVTGIAYYDAISLSLLDPGNWLDRKAIFDILSYYKGTDIDSANVATAFSANAFLADYIRILSFNAANTNGSVIASTAGKFSLPAALGAVGGLDVTSIADGVAQFIVNRTKQELNVAFFDKFRKTLDDDKFADLRSIFPETYRCLRAIGNDIYNYNAYLQTLREAFQKDLSTLPANLPLIVDNHKTFFDANRELRAVLLSGFYFAGQIQDHAHPGDIIAGYDASLLNDLDPNYKAAIQTIQVISGSLRNKDDDKRYWVAQSDIRKLLGNHTQLMLYMGLLTEQINKEHIDFVINGTPLHLYNEINSHADSLLQYRNFLQTFAQKAELIEKKISTIQDKAGDSLMLENYYSFFTSTIDLLKYCRKVGDLPGLHQLRIRDTADKYLNAGEIIANIGIDVNRRKYATAIVDLTAIYNIIKTWPRDASAHAAYVTAVSPSRKERNALVAAAKSYKNHPGSATLAGIKTAADNADTVVADVSSLDDNSNAIFKYGTFMATIVQAQSSDDVAAAIEAFAMPAGSARVKRESNFNVAVNAYCGLYAGYEKIQGLAMDKPFTSLRQINSSGIAAPIGISFSAGRISNFLQPNGKGHWSQTIFVSLIDLGAVTAYRFNSNNDTVKQVPSIQLKDIFSPGIFWSIGIPRSPISVNLGTQIGPNLRGVSAGTNTYENNLYWRYSISILVDIPVLNLYTVTK